MKALRYFKGFPVGLLLIAFFHIVAISLVFVFASQVPTMALWTEEGYADMRAWAEVAGIPMSAYFFWVFVAMPCAVIAGFGFLMKRPWSWWLECGVALHMGLLHGYHLFNTGLVS